MNLIGATLATVVADSRGMYSFPGLAPRSYAIQWEGKGFSPEVQARLLVQQVTIWSLRM